MNKFHLSFLLILTLTLVTGCTSSVNNLSDDIIDRSQKRLEFRSTKFPVGIPDKNIFRELNLSKEETNAMEFLYAYMPLSDIADYTIEFHLKNARIAIKTKKARPWGSSISDEYFYHFVLPVRVNNEYLDSFRIAYYEEISHRIEGIESIEKAALEINHWCHEKVTYQPADLRTSSPLSTVLSAQGRCGEESTFTVSALRTAGIPARQVYTPRWAHTDDNHAWVEIWNGQEWRYLGACEPEPTLDRGWFTEPARRAMLVQTKTFGQYFGNENTTFRNYHFAEINNLDKYAKTKVISVRVLDSKGGIAPGAKVEFQLYNYSELYPLASLTTDSSAYVSFTTGLGDLVIWASLDNRYIFKNISVDDCDTLTLSLPDNIGEIGQFSIRLHSPPVLELFEGISPDMVSINNKYLAQEDSIRHSYTSTWMKIDDMVLFASKYNYKSDQVVDILSRSKGNYNQILKVLELKANDPEKQHVVSLLMEVSDKDLRDTPFDVFIDHLSISYDSIQAEYSEDYFNKYILNPRISDELISPWRQFLISYFQTQQNEFKRDPKKIAYWIGENIKIYDAENYYGVPISPAGSIKLLSSDSFSSKILFVAICRSLGIPSRLEKGTNIPQYYNNGFWVSIEIDNQLNKSIAYSTIYFSYSTGSIIPEYYKHFTIAKFKNGRFNTLQYPVGTSIDVFDQGLILESGRYMLVSGNRINDSRVLATINIFDIAPDEVRTIAVNLEEDQNKRHPISDFNLDRFELLASQRDIDLPKSDNGLVIAWIEHEKEPTKHLLNDLPSKKSEFDSLGVGFLFFSDPSTISASYNPGDLSNLPENTTFLLDSNLDFLSKLLADRLIKDISYPYILFSDKNGNLYFLAEGYRVGMSDLISGAIKF